MLLAVAPLVLYLAGGALDLTLAGPCATARAPTVLLRRLLLGLLAAAWLGVTLAQLGRFSAPVLLAVLLAVALGLLSWQLMRQRSLARLAALGGWGPAGERLALAALLGVATLLFAHPGEDVLGARDPGIYFATGIAIARTGGVVHHDPTLAALGAALGDVSRNYWLFQSVHGWPLRFPGQLFVRDLAAGTVEPGFFPWYPTLVALAVGLGGLEAGLWVNPLLATLAVVLVYLTARRLVGPLAAWLAAVWLVLNLGQVWFARYTMAEPAAQLLLWSGLFAASMARERSVPAWGVLAGLAWGGLLLARADSVLLLPVLLGYLAWAARTAARRPFALPALGLLLLGGAQAIWHAAALAPAYSTMTFSRATLTVAAGGVIGVLLLAAAVWTGAVYARQPTVRRWLPVALVVALVLGALFAYLVRPALPAPALSGEAAELERAARESLVRLGWYVTPLGLLLALVGAGTLAVSGSWRPGALLLALLALSLAFYLPNPLVSADHPWAVRRYLPVVLPGLLVLAAHGAASVGHWAWRGPCSWWRPRGTLRWPGAGRGAGPLLLTIALGVAVGLGEWQATAAIAGYREHAGALAQVRALAGRVPPDAIVLFPWTPAGLRLALPLHYVGERGSVVLPTQELEPGVVAVVRRWLAEGRTVYWVVPQGTRFPTPPGLRLRPAGQFVFAVPQLERPVDRLPQTAQPVEFALQLYRLQPDP
ncbi:MAG TPA: glycosyltransferase family 39 protein [Chloroflexota bacterium]|nr:glycosyltransferase family 39 protein [Chloroflexota bacterium]